MEIKSQLTQCPNGHYYNAALHATCPICAGQAADLGVTPTDMQSGGESAGGFAPTEAPGSAGATVDNGYAGNFAPTEAPGAGMGNVGNFGPTEVPGAGAGNAGFNMGVKTEAVPEGNVHGNSAADPFSATIIGGEVGGMNTAPVVGWLVCTDGPMRGEDFRLHAGYNYIGREVGDVRITGDLKVSRQNHAMIAFDDEDLTFYAGPAEGRNLLKINGKAVLNAIELHSYDTIAIGSTKLIFVALCGEHFDWRKE